MDKPPGYSMFFDLRGRRDSERRNDDIRRVRLSPADGVAFLTRDRERYLAPAVRHLSGSEGGAWSTAR